MYDKEIFAIFDSSKTFKNITSLSITVNIIKKKNRFNPCQKDFKKVVLTRDNN